MSSSLCICSIDPSITSTGIAILEVDLKSNTFKLIDKTSFDNKRKFNNRWEKKEAARELFEFYLQDKIDLIDLFIFEDYSYASIGYLADAGEMVGLFKHYIWSHKKPFDTIAPATVKRIVAGDGRAQKEDVAKGLHKFVENIASFKFNNLDETDAVGIGIAYILYSIEKNEQQQQQRKDSASSPNTAAKPRRKSGKDKKPDRKDRSPIKGRPAKRPRIPNSSS